jgi:hypothetical protein
LLAVVLAGVLAAPACSNVGANVFHPYEGLGGSGGNGANGSTASGSGGGGFMFDGSAPPPPPDASGLCGNEVHKITSAPPTVYFIFDISGSMVTPVPGGTRYSMLQTAASKLVQDLRYVIKVGAAVFPLQTGVDECHIGGEIYPPTFGDPASFESITADIQPNGGTPTAATLTALTPKLAALPGKIIAILTTDGGANCNPNAVCTAAECTENIEGCAPTDACCSANVNCCAPNGPAGPINCIDHAAVVAAAGALNAAGVKLYVIGIPGSQPYATVLADMAFAGGAPQPSKPFYYDVQDLTTLSAILEQIAGNEVSCDITIDMAPTTPDDTNVYFGQQLLLQDPLNGWSWSAPNVITLNGKACAELRSGAVSQVQVVTGCPTQTM